MSNQKAVWIDEDNYDNCFDDVKGIVTDPRNLRPYRGASYGGGVESLLSSFKCPEVKDLKGVLTENFSCVKEWMGTWNDEIDGIVATRWIKGETLFDLACKRNPDLKNILAKRKSKDNKTPFEKFIENMGTIQRTGGEFVYAGPLMWCLFAIDSRYVDHKGKRVIEFRMAIGRSEPQIGGLRGYKEEKIAAAIRVKEARKASRAKNRKNCSRKSPCKVLQAAS